MVSKSVSKVTGISRASNFLIFFSYSFDFGCYLKLNIVSVRAIFLYLLCLCIPVFTGYRNAQTDRFFAVVMEK